MIARATWWAVGIIVALLVATAAWATWHTGKRAIKAEQAARDSMAVRQERARQDSIRNDSLEIALGRERRRADSTSAVLGRVLSTPLPTRPVVRTIDLSTLQRDSLVTIIHLQEHHIDSLEGRLTLARAEFVADSLARAEERASADSLIAGKDRQLANTEGALHAAQRALALASGDCRISLLVTSLPCPTRTQVAVGAFIAGAAGAYALAR